MLLNDPAFLQPLFQDAGAAPTDRRRPAAPAGLREFARRWKFIAIFLGFSLIAGVAHAVLSEAPPPHLATQSVKIHALEWMTSRTLDEPFLDPKLPRKHLYQDYLLVFGRGEVYDRTVKALDLAAAERDLWRTAESRTLRTRLFKGINRCSEKIFGAPVRRLPSGDADFESRARYRLRTSFRADIDHQADHVLSVTYRSPYPDVTTRAVTAEVIVQANRLFRQETALGRHQVIAERVRDARRDEYERAREELGRFRRRHGLAGDAFRDDLHDRYRTHRELIAKKSELEEEIHRLHVDERSARQEAEARAVFESRYSPSSPREILLRELQRDLRTAERDLRVVAGERPVDHREVEQATVRCQVIRSEILEVSGRIGSSSSVASSAELEKLRHRADRIHATRALREDQLAQVQSELQRIGDAGRKLHGELEAGLLLVSRWREARQTWEAALKQCERIHLELTLGHESIPFRPVGDTRIEPTPWVEVHAPELGAVAVTLFGLFIGIALAAARELSDRRVRCARDLEQELELPMIASIPRCSRLRPA